FHVPALARKHVTACVPGDGGDELFAGYTPYADALARIGSAPVDALRSAIGAGARFVSTHARGKGRLSTLALGPEAWFVWRRTVFPDYLLESVVDRDVVKAAAQLPERQAVMDIRGGAGTLVERLPHWELSYCLPGDIKGQRDRRVARYPGRPAQPAAWMDASHRGRGAAAAARERLARSRETNLGARLSRAVGAHTRRSRQRTIASTRRRPPDHGECSILI